MHSSKNYPGGKTATDLRSSHVIFKKRELHIEVLFSSIYYGFIFVMYMLFITQSVAYELGINFSIAKFIWKCLRYGYWLLPLFKSFSFQVIDDTDFSRERYLRKAKDVYNDFIKLGKVHYLGCYGMNLPNISGVRYPIDYFIKHFYDRFHSKESIEAFATYRRVNPDLDLRLDHLAEFTVEKEFKVGNNELKIVLQSLKDEFSSSIHFSDFKTKLYEFVKFRKFYDLSVDLTSAAGYPYQAGVKRRDCFEDALMKATDMMNDEVCFSEFMHDHCWYTTGRARLIKQTKIEDKGRLIMYAGFSPMLIAMLTVQPVALFMNEHLDWCAVGSSWMYGGAKRFANYFRADKGYAPKGFRYVSVDIKSWDAHLHPKLLYALKDFYEWLLYESNVAMSDIDNFIDIFEDMIEANILFPGGHLFKLFQGMKSGWASTANDNTLIHKIVMFGIEKEMQLNILHKLYGDDNFMLVPDEVTDEMIVNSYSRYGCTVGTIHSSIYLGDVDFLCKYIHYRDGEYFVFRPPVETHARLLMPEELNPGFRDVPDSKVAAERCLGHLLDNPFCKSVRVICLDLLKRLKNDYGIAEVFVDERMKKKGPWKRIDILGPVPIVPSEEFISELYGVNPVPLRRPWPGRTGIHKFNWIKHDASSIRFDTAYNYSRQVLGRIGFTISRKRYKKLLSHTSPYVVPRTVYGTHAARLEFAIMYFDIDYQSALDFGSHPGACAASLLKRSKDVTCVSLFPERDQNRAFCPYVFKDQAVRLINMDVEEYVVDRKYDLLHDDVDVLGSRSRFVDINLAVKALRRGIKLSRKVNVFVMTIREYNPEIFELIHQCYVAYGSFNIVKPHYSNPWRFEFMLCFKRINLKPVRKRSMLTTLNHFLNSHAASMIEWSDCLSDNYEDLITEHGYVLCPLQKDNEWIKSLSSDFLF
jgi:hypothetical protein